MSRLESEASDRPFPGAHSQVPGARQEPDSASRHAIPLEASPVRNAQGWTIQLHVRAEQVHVSKRTVTRERVTVRRGVVQESVRLEGQVSREVLRVETEGDVSVGPTENSAAEAARGNA